MATNENKSITEGKINLVVSFPCDLYIVYWKYRVCLQYSQQRSDIF